MLYIFIADPDVILKEMGKDHEFVVMASDGIWDVLTNQDVVEFVRERIGRSMEPDVVSVFIIIRRMYPKATSSMLSSK